MKNKYAVFWTNTARQDLVNTFDYIFSQDAVAACRLYSRIKDKATQLNHLPLRGRIVPELKEHGITEYRELIESRWRIIYKITRRDVFIVSLIDSRRNFEDILLERFMSL